MDLTLPTDATTLALMAFGLINAMTFALFGWDKRQSIRDGWRVPENRLLFFALIGGSPAALAAQRVFRHKTRKQPFKTILYAIVLVQIVVILATVFGEF